MNQWTGAQITAKPFTMPCCGRVRNFETPPVPGDYVWCPECETETRLPPVRKKKYYGTTNCCGSPVLPDGRCGMCLREKPSIRKGYGQKNRPAKVIDDAS